MNKEDTLKIKARDALNFLEGHPALGIIVKPLFSNLWFSIEKICKRGYTEHCKDRFDVGINSKYAFKFKDEFKKEYQKLQKTVTDKKSFDLQKRFIRIYTKYEKVFDESWKYDHIEYWGELGFNIYVGNPKIKQWVNPKNWACCAGVEIGGRSFEEMIIKITRQFKRRFGNFENIDFYTKREIENNRKEKIFFHVPLNDGTGCSRLKSNPKYIDVNEAELNRRWLKWFSQTEYCKKTWGKTVTDALKGKRI